MLSAQSFFSEVVSGVFPVRALCLHESEGSLVLAGRRHELNAKFQVRWVSLYYLATSTPGNAQSEGCPNT